MTSGLPRRADARSSETLRNAWYACSVSKVADVLADEDLGADA